MNKESPQFTQPNAVELIEVTIKSDLTKAGITIQPNSVEILDNKFSVTTDQKVPEDIMSSIREYVENKGFTIKFVSSE